MRCTGKSALEARRNWGCNWRWEETRETEQEERIVRNKTPSVTTDVHPDIRRHGSIQLVTSIRKGQGCVPLVMQIGDDVEVKNVWRS